MTAPEKKPWHDEEVVAHILQSAFVAYRPEARTIVLPNGDRYQVSMKPAPGVDGVWFLVHCWRQGLDGTAFEVTVKEVTK